MTFSQLTILQNTNPRGDPGQEQTGQEQAEYGAAYDPVHGERELGCSFAHGVEGERSRHHHRADDARQQFAHQQPLGVAVALGGGERAHKVLDYQVAQRVLAGRHRAVRLIGLVKWQLLKITKPTHIEFL